MATTYATNFNKVLNGGTPAPGFVNGVVRSSVEQITYASQASGDKIGVGRFPKGSIPLGIEINTGTSTSSATLAFGTLSSSAKYAAASAYTTTDTPTRLGKAAALNVALTSDDDVYATIGTAALPSSGTLNVTLYFTFG